MEPLRLDRPSRAPAARLSSLKSPLVCLHDDAGLVSRHVSRVHRLGRCRLRTFQYFGGISGELLHDNLNTVVLDRAADGAIHWNPRHLEFVDYYGFTPRTCQPYRAQTKGKVESGVKYVRGNFWPGLQFIDLADLNCQALDWLNGVANVRLHGTTGEVPFARLPLEELQSVGAKPAYGTSLITDRRSSSGFLISCEGNFYSVPAPYAKQRLLRKEIEHGEL